MNKKTIAQKTRRPNLLGTIVLVVDDLIDYQAPVQEMLELLYECIVIACTDPDDLLSIVSTIQPDLVFMDGDLGKGKPSGEVLTTVLHGKYPDMPIYANSGGKRSNDLMMACGATGVTSKSWQLALDVLEKVAKKRTRD